MNTIEIRLSKKNATVKVKPILQVVELFLARKNVFITQDEKATLLEDMSGYLERINLTVEEN